MPENIQTEIGLLPPDWLVQRVDSLFDIQQGKSVSKANRIGDNQKPFLRTKNIYWGRIDLSDLDHMHFDKVEEEKLRLKKGDLLLCEGGDVGRTAIWMGDSIDCYYQNHLHRLRQKDEKEVDPLFALYWFWYAFEFSHFYKGRSNVTTIPNLSQSKLSELPIPKPEISEQKKIASIIRLVQSAIEQQERMIALTQELKSAMMHKLFTEGLHGEPQKQTDIGLIPESWEVGKLESIITDTPIINLKKDRNRVIKYIDVSSISREILRIQNTTRYTLSEAPGRARKLVNKGDVIFATIRPTLLRVAYIEDDYDNEVCSTAFCVLRPNVFEAGRFIYYIVQRVEFIRELSKIQSGASYPAVTDGQVKSMFIPIPNLDEQMQIGNILSTIDKKIYLLYQKRNILQELFNSLLSKLMTGQIRVNNIELPELS
jgi:type I restriction enzyme S subunit